jgi:tRNA-2-methylthio-N6-dimethylallyladenosine synthase
MQQKVFIKTFGCQMNVYDSDRIFDSIKKIGYEKTEKYDDANCFILNTCHIRDKAKEKVYHEIGRVKKIFRKKKKPIIIIAGCVAQAENKEMLTREPYIDIIIGPQSYHKINDTILNYAKDKKKEEVTDFDVIEKFNYLSKIKNKDSKVSSFLTIQEGCDKFCNFCVVPFTRGPEYSRPFKQILNEAKQMIKNGTKEIILIGQNVNAYSSLENKNKYKLSNLILELEKLPELKRIRYTTSHPKDMTDDLIQCYKISKKLMPIIHLPVQSGSNNILNKMNRKHTIEDYLLIYQKLKNINKNIEFSSDFIISYPGETEEDFQDTLNLLNKIKFINSYSFIFSPRPGTVAGKLKTIDKEVSEKRLKTIQDQLFKNQLETNKSLEGKVIDVLVENQTKDKKKLFGRTSYMTSVIFNGDKKNIGKIVKVEIDSSNQSSLFGKIKLTQNKKAA